MRFNIEFFSFSQTWVIAYTYTLGMPWHDNKPFTVNDALIELNEYRRNNKNKITRLVII